MNPRGPRALAMLATLVIASCTALGSGTGTSTQRPSTQQVEAELKSRSRAEAEFKALEGDCKRFLEQSHTKISKQYFPLRSANALRLGRAVCMIELGDERGGALLKRVAEDSKGRDEGYEALARLTGGTYEPSKLISGVKPKHPRTVEKGWAYVRFAVNSTGAVSKVWRMPPNGDEQLANATTAAIKEWRYKPALFNGKPVDSCCKTALIWFRKR